MEDGMQRGYHRHSQILDQPDDIGTVTPPENAEFVLEDGNVELVDI